MSSPGGHQFGTETWPHPTACRLQCWDTSGQTTNWVGTQPHPSADRLPKVVLIPQLPLHISLDTALPTRGTGHPAPCTSGQGVPPTGPSHQDTCTGPGPTSPTRGQTPEARRATTCSLRNRGHKHRKLDKKSRQRNMLQTKEQDKTPKDQLNEVEIGNLPEKEFRVMIVKMTQDLRKRMEA